MIDFEDPQLPADQAIISQDKDQPISNGISTSSTLLTDTCNLPILCDPKAPDFADYNGNGISAQSTLPTATDYTPPFEHHEPSINMIDNKTLNNFGN